MICEYCKKEHNGKYGSGRFCCKKCARGFSTLKNRKEINKKVSKTLKGYRTIPGGKIKLCDYGCGQEAKVQLKNGKWCCQNSFNQCPSVREKNSRSHSISKKEYVYIKKETNCLFCNKELTRNQYKYCNNKCQNNHLYKKWIKKWLSNKIDGTVKSGQSSYIKRWLIETYGEKCSICGWNKINKVTNKVPVEVDHIDGNYTNNSPENVRLVCPNCHSLTPTYKNLNKGNGRKYRTKQMPI